MRKLYETWRPWGPITKELTEAARFGSRMQFPAEAQLYRQGDVSPYFFFILSGRVRISMTDREGNEFLMEIMGPDSICGEGAAFDGLPRFSSATAIEATEAVRFDTRSLTSAFADRPALAMELLRITSFKQRILALKLQGLSSNDPKERVSELLGRLARLFATRDGERWVLKISLTHDEIGGMTGLSRVTVTRTLKSLRAAGKLQIDGDTIVLNDPSWVDGE